MNIGAISLEMRMRLDIDDDQRIAPICAAMSFAALTAQSDLPAAFDAGWHGDLHGSAVREPHALFCAIGGVQETDRKAVGPVLSARPENPLSRTAYTFEQLGKKIVGRSLDAGIGKG